MTPLLPSDGSCVSWNQNERSHCMQVGASWLLSIEQGWSTYWPYNSIWLTELTVAMTSRRRRRSSIAGNCSRSEELQNYHSFQALDDKTQSQSRGGIVEVSRRLREEKINYITPSIRASTWTNSNYRRETGVGTTTSHSIINPSHSILKKLVRNAIDSVRRLWFLCLCRIFVRFD